MIDKQTIKNPVTQEQAVFVTWAHNAEKTLRRTIDSVLAQTYKNFDYIVIDNASSDNTSDIVREYAQRDSRVQLWTNEKNMMGAELYAMIQERLRDSSANYFVNIDADDEYMPCFLEKSLEFMTKNDLDLVCCGSDFINEQTKQLKGRRALGKNLIIEGSGFSDFFPYYHVFMRTTWGKVYKRWVLLENDYSVMPHVVYGADTLFTFEALHNVSRVGILAGTLHKYYMDPTSVSYKWDATRVESTRAMYKEPHDMLIGKCGVVSARNEEFLLLICMSELQDALNVLLKSNIPAVEKLSAVLDMFSHEYSKRLAAAKRFGALNGNAVVGTQRRKALFASAAEFLLSLVEVPDSLVEQFCNVGEFVCAAAENAEGWVLFNKLRVRFLFDNGRVGEAKAKLDELSELLPNDEKA